MNAISAQISLYPLRQPHLSPAIDDAVQICRARGLETRTGPMSTVVRGEADEVFAALREAFTRTAERGDVVMVVTLSNRCPSDGQAGVGEPG